MGESALAFPRRGSFAPVGLVLALLAGAGPLLAGACPPDPRGVECATCIDAPPRFEHTAARVSDGRVLVIGGRGVADPAHGTAVFDPGTAGFVAGPLMVQPRRGHLQVELPTADVVVIGGTAPGIGAVTVIEVYRAASDRFEALGDLPAPLVEPVTAGLLRSGSVAISSVVHEGAERWRAVDVFDLETGATVRADLRLHIDDDVRALGDGTVLVYGDPDPGDGDGRWVVRRLEVTGAVITEVGTLPGPFATAHTGVTGALLADGTVLYAGGWVRSADGATSLPTAAVFLVDPDAGTLDLGPDMFVGRGTPLVVALPGGGALVADCTSQCAVVNPLGGGHFVEVLGPGGDTWTRHGLALSRVGATYTGLDDGRVLVVGGWGQTVIDGFGGSFGPLPFAELITATPATP